jgi:hypothetical protein
MTMNDRQMMLEIELQHTVNNLKILVDLLEKENYPSTIKQVRSTINTATALLNDEH